MTPLVERLIAERVNAAAIEADLRASADRLERSLRNAGSMGPSPAHRSLAEARAILDHIERGRS